MKSVKNIDNVYNTLKNKQIDSASWHDRYKKYYAATIENDLIGIADGVRDLHLRRKQTYLSFGEKKALLSLTEILTGKLMALSGESHDNVTLNIHRCLGA